MDNWLTTNKPNWGSNWGAGDVMYKDLNGDGIVSSGANTLDDHGDLKRIGNATPRYRIGLNLDAAYKGFDFSIFFQGVLKRDWFFGAGDAYFWGAQGNMWQSACFEDHLDYWTENNTGAYYPKPYFGGIQKNQQTQTRYLQSAAYLRCKNIHWGYTLPKSLLSPPESVIAAFICHVIIYSLSLVCPIYLIPKLSEDMVTKDGAVVKLIRCNVLFLWV